MKLEQIETMNTIVPKYMSASFSSRDLVPCYPKEWWFIWAGGIAGVPN